MQKVSLFFVGILIGAAITTSISFMYHGAQPQIIPPEEIQAASVGQLLRLESIKDGVYELGFVRDYQIVQLPEYWGENMSTDLFQIDSIVNNVPYMSFFNDSTCIQVN